MRARLQRLAASAFPRISATAAALFCCWFLAVPAHAAWSIRTVEPARLVEYTFLALDPSGRPAILHGEEGVHHVYHDGVSWQTESVDPDPCARAQDLAFDAAGEPVVAYEDLDDQTLRLARRSGPGAWAFEVIDPATGGA